MAEKGGKKNRKIGRSRRNGQAMQYRLSRRRERNKLRRLERHLKRFPDDHCATSRRGNLRIELGLR